MDFRAPYQAILDKARRGRSRSLRFVSDVRGAAAVEFAMISIPFLLIFCAIFESAFLVFNQGNLEYATYEASRQLLVGYGQNNNWTASDFSNAVCANLWKNFTCANLMVDVRSAADFTGSLDTTKDFTSAYNPSSPTYNPGASGNVVVARVAYPYKLYFSAFSGMGSGSKVIMATAVFKAE